MLWIVGKIFKDFQIYLEANKLPYGLFWDVSLPLPETNVPVRKLDFTKPETLAQQVSAYEDIQVTALMVAGYENYVLSAAYLSDYFGVPGPSVAA